jgi:hypothetical protein
MDNSPSDPGFFDWYSWEANMADHTPRNEMAERLAREVRHAQFEKNRREGMAGFGGRDGADAKERRTLWQKAAPSPLRPAGAVAHPDGDHPAGGISGAPPLPSWSSSTGR